MYLHIDPLEINTAPTDVGLIRKMVYFASNSRRSNGAFIICFTIRGSTVETYWAITVSPLGINRESTGAPLRDGRGGAP